METTSFSWIALIQNFYLHHLVAMNTQIWITGHSAWSFDNGFLRIIVKIKAHAWHSQHDWVLISAQMFPIQTMIYNLNRFNYFRNNCLHNIFLTIHTKGRKMREKVVDNNIDRKPTYWLHTITPTNIERQYTWTTDASTGGYRKFAICHCK